MSVTQDLKNSCKIPGHSNVVLNHYITCESYDHVFRLITYITYKFIKYSES